MSTGYQSGDFELVWPRELFRTELASLIAGRGEVGNWFEMRSWYEGAEFLLEEAFATAVPRDTFSSTHSTPDPWGPAAEFLDSEAAEGFLNDLFRHVDDLPESVERPPYWSERKSLPTAGGIIPIQALTARFAKMVHALLDRGYFEETLGRDCVDGPPPLHLAEILEDLTDKSNLWPLDPVVLAEDRDAFFDLVEALYDLVSRPTHRWFHDMEGCYSWHYRDYSQQAGRSLYAWRVNQLLDDSSLGVLLATEGEDAGRLVEVTDDARAYLVHRMIEREEMPAGGPRRHAIALFRRRSATEHDKRSAVVTLAQVLEERRALLTNVLLSKDEQALFQIANQFAIRHEDGRQQRDYDPVFLDWIFWWYLATVELTDRLIERQASSD